MTRGAFVIRELGRHIKRNPGTIFSALLSLTLLFVLFDMFWVAARSTDEMYHSVIADLQMEVFLPDSVSDSMVTQIGSRIQTMEGIRSLSFVTREAAREELVRLVGVDLLAGDSLNPLPRSFVLFFEPEYLTLGRLREIQKQLVQISGTSQIQYGEKWLESVEKTRGLIRRVGLIIGFFILLATVISSTNNIRLMSRARGAGLLQMQLLGAGRAFISLPFVLEGALLSGVASVLSWLVVWYGRGELDFVKVTISMPQTRDVVTFCVLTTVLGAMSGYYGVRKLLA